MQEYADPVIDWLDAGQGILGRRLFREVGVPHRNLNMPCLILWMQSCTQLTNGSYTKNLALVEQDLARVCLVDNSPVCYSENESAYSCAGLLAFSLIINCRRVSECHPDRGLDA
jgi:CTD nuclear envelope phosphatase 1